MAVHKPLLVGMRSEGETSSSSSMIDEDMLHGVSSPSPVPRNLAVALFLRMNITDVNSEL